MQNQNEIIPIVPDKNLPLINCHCHLPYPWNFQRNTKDYEAQYTEFFEMNGKYLITSSIDLETLKMMKAFISNHQNIGLTAGWAPQTVTHTEPKKHAQDFPKFLEFVINNPDKYLAIGEIGLDFHHAKTLLQRETQITFFRQIIRKTKHLGKPYVLHVRNPNPENPKDRDPGNPNHPYNEKDAVNKLMIRILEEEQIPPDIVMWHCFSGPKEWGAKLAEMGYMLSVPSSAYGFSRWRKNSENVPLSNLLTETDSPFQHPVEMDGFNTPLNVSYSIATIAYTHNLSQDKVATTIIRNSQEFFGLKD